MTNKGFNLYSYLQVFNENKKPILLITAVVLVASFIVAFFVLDPIYFSNGVLKTAAKSSKLGGLLSSSGLPDLGDFGDLASGGGGGCIGACAL